MDAERVEMQIAALLDQSDVEHARVREAISELRAAGVVLEQGVTRAAGIAVQGAFKGLQKDIERARSAMTWFFNPRGRELRDVHPGGRTQGAQDDLRPANAYCVCAVGFSNATFIISA